MPGLKNESIVVVIFNVTAIVCVHCIVASFQVCLFGFLTFVCLFGWFLNVLVLQSISRTGPKTEI